MGSPEANKRWLEKNPNYMKKYSEDNRDSLLANKKEYYKNNKEVMNKNMANHYIVKKDEYLVRARKAGLKRYNLTVEMYNKMFADQNGCCDICGRHQSEFKKRFAVDHDHACCPGDKSCGKCVRGLLCIRCNRGIGLFGDDVSVIDRCKLYLTKHSTINVNP